MEKRIEREKRILANMISKYCEDHHNVSGNCKSCNELQDYAFKRLISCPFSKDKPVCSKCTIHCYNKNQREKIKEVMRYSGPKMIFSNPKDTVLYFFDKLKNKNHKVETTETH